MACVLTVSRNALNKIWNRPYSIFIHLAGDVANEISNYVFYGSNNFAFHLKV
jgi:hypothetical protein